MRSPNPERPETAGEPHRCPGFLPEDSFLAVVWESFLALGDGAENPRRSWSSQDGGLKRTELL